MKVREPETWKPAAEPRIAELFTPELKRFTTSGLCMAIVALVTWWSCSAFIPVVATSLVKELVPAPMGVAAALKKAEFITIGTTAFNFGGLVGTLLTVPLATHLGRRPMYALYFSASAAALLLTFVPDWEPITRLRLLFTVGVTVFGVFGSFTFYLPELFPSRLRGTGSGFTYNVGRIATAAFPFAVGYLVQSGTDPLVVMSFVALAPAIGVVLVLTGVAVETREKNLAA